MYVKVIVAEKKWWCALMKEEPICCYKMIVRIRFWKKGSYENDKYSLWLYVMSYFKRARHVSYL